MRISSTARQKVSPVETGNRQVLLALTIVGDTAIRVIHRRYRRELAARRPMDRCVTLQKNTFRSLPVEHKENETMRDKRGSNLHVLLRYIPYTRRYKLYIFISERFMCVLCGYYQANYKITND